MSFKLYKGIVELQNLKSSTFELSEFKESSSNEFIIKAVPLYYGAIELSKKYLIVIDLHFLDA